MGLVHDKQSRLALNDPSRARRPRLLFCFQSTGYSYRQNRGSDSIHLASE